MQNKCKIFSFVPNLFKIIILHFNINLVDQELLKLSEKCRKSSYCLNACKLFNRTEGSCHDNKCMCKTDNNEKWLKDILTQRNQSGTTYIFDNIKY